jgi:hypothetical protein
MRQHCPKAQRDRLSSEKGGNLGGDLLFVSDPVTGIITT